VTRKRVLIALLFVCSFIVSIIYGPRNEIADITAGICLVSFIIYFLALRTLPKNDDQSAEMIDAFFWTIFAAFVLASFVRGFGLGYIFDNMFLDFARIYFP
jgi:hypothetical protein